MNLLHTEVSTLGRLGTDEDIGTNLGECGMEVPVLPQRNYASLSRLDAAEPIPSLAKKRLDKERTTHKTNPYPLSLSLTCLVNVLTLFTSPNGAVNASNCSSGK